jgi:uncharacterized protein
MTLENSTICNGIKRLAPLSMARFLTDSGHKDGAHLVLAHGAGAPMTSPFMTAMATVIAAAGITVHRFEFAYMAARREGGSRRPPPKISALMQEYRDAVTEICGTLSADQPLFIGGKSMGGRVASLIADDVNAQGRVRGLVCLGYPFHPPGKPDVLRTAHLQCLACPALIVQGERDPFGTRDEVATYTLSNAITLEWLPDANHDFKPRAKSGVTHDENLAGAAHAVARFVTQELVTTQV